MPETSSLLQAHPPMEFMYALFYLGTKKNFLHMLSDFQLTPDDEFSEFTDAMESGLSRFLRQDLVEFFDLSGLGYLFYKSILRHEDLHRIDEVIDRLEKAGPDAFIHDMMGSVCKDTYPVNAAGKTGPIPREIMSEMVETTGFADEERKRKVLEVITHPAELHDRLVFFLRRFYRTAYLPIESKVQEVLASRLKAFQASYESDPAAFLQTYVNASMDQIQGSGTVKIHISLFKQIGCHNYSPGDTGGSYWFVLGTRFDEALQKGTSGEQIVAFFKALSDPKRIEIVRHLSERSYYGQELAEKLQITPATVSYHMTFLQNLNLVSYERSDNRYYYSLNGSVMERCFELSKHTLLKR